MTERFGFLPESIEPTGSGAIWFHAVSVGEVLSLVPLLKSLHTESPAVQLFVSTATIAGRKVAGERLQGIAQGVFYAPLDYKSMVRRVLRRLRPRAVVIMETEIWPNLFRETKRAGIGLMMINGRISDRALPRYEKLRGFFQHVLCWPDAILTQTDEDTRRFVLAGAPVERVRAEGNLKFDFSPPASGIAAEIDDFLNRHPQRRVVIAASTMPPAAAGDPDEDDVVIAAYKHLSIAFPDLLLIQVPRHPQRFDVVAEKLTAAGVPFVRRTLLQEIELPCVLLLDTVGELGAMFAHAEVVFMGGTLASRGGHNILEPAYFAKPVIIGPHMANFAAIGGEFSAMNAVVSIDDESTLAAAVEGLLNDRDRARAIGMRAQQLTESKRGVAKRLAAEIWRASELGVAEVKRPIWARLVLAPLSWIWRVGGRIKARRDLARRRSLQQPVISVGGLAMGGSGKTPLVTHLAERLHELGKNPAILTRGYKRKSSQSVVLVARGKKATLDLTGDEAQVFIRSGHAHVGIASDRFEAGTQVETELAPDVFLLDDGFQHRRLARKHDIVLIDALDPFGGGVFPLGRRREPMSALARASAFIVTRADFAHPPSGIERILRRWNASAPIFRSRLTAIEWVEKDSQIAIGVRDPHFGPAAAFCGLGNPRSFWSTLEELKLPVCFRWAFGDHHSYRADELRKLAQQATAHGAECLVTTEKDAVNLPADASAIVAPLRIYWLRIGVEIDREEELLKLIS